VNVSCCTSVSLGRVADHHYRNVNTSGGNEALSQSMHGGAATRVTLDGLADMLWGDALPSNWKQALRATSSPRCGFVSTRSVGAATR